MILLYGRVVLNSQDLNKYMESQSLDATQAMDTLNLIQSLFSNEISETTDTAQLSILQSVIDQKRKS